jgi:hypothetical protein
MREWICLSVLVGQEASLTLEATLEESRGQPLELDELVPVLTASTALAQGRRCSSGCRSRPSWCGGAIDPPGETVVLLPTRRRWLMWRCLTPNGTGGTLVHVRPGRSSGAAPVSDRPKAAGAACASRF